MARPLPANKVVAPAILISVECVWRAGSPPPPRIFSRCVSSHSRKIDERKRRTGNSVCWHLIDGPAFAVNARLDQERCAEMLDGRLDKFVRGAGKFVSRLSYRSRAQSVLLALFFWRIHIRSDVHWWLPLSGDRDATDGSRLLTIYSRSDHDCGAAELFPRL